MFPKTHILIKIAMRIFPKRPAIPFILLLMFVLTLTLTSCEQQVISREYEEITITSPLEHHMGPHGDPHTFMKNAPFMGFDHPDISQGIQMADAQNDPQLQKALDASVAKAPLSWRTPEGWSEEKGSSMRVVTFRTKDDTGGIECSIVTLGGQAGGVQSNVVRWMKQINLDVPPTGQLREFLSRQETLKAEGGFNLKMIDMTEFVQEASFPSMIAAIAELQDMTIFVKMTGAKESLIENRDKFKSLCQSLKIK